MCYEISAKKKKNLIISGGIIILLIFSAFLIGKNISKSGSAEKNNIPPNNELPNKPNTPPSPQKPNCSQKKELANIIKTDLKNIKDIGEQNWEYLKEHHDDFFKLNGNIHFLSSDENKQKKIEKITGVRESGCRIFPSDLEKQDYDEIVTLINQIRKLWKEKSQEEQERIKRELEQKKSILRPGLFYHHSCSYWDPRGDGSFYNFHGRYGSYYNFIGKEDGKEFQLEIPVNHLSLNGVDSTKEYFLIDLPDSIRLENFTEDDYSYYKKFVEWEDRITITPYNL